MPPSNLKDNVTSNYIEARNKMASPPQILVYVEGDEDIPFWRDALLLYEGKERSFNIQTPTKRGKKEVLKRYQDLLSLSTGPNLLICVDSDYDFLLQGSTTQSKQINENPFIFQTYSYAIENLHCFSETLHSVCVHASKCDEKLVDFQDFLYQFSTITYKLLVWSVYFHKQNDHDSFTIHDFCNTIKFQSEIKPGSYQDELQELEQRVGLKIEELEKAFPNLIDRIEQLGLELAKLGLNECNAYLFINGHTIKSNVVLMLLKPVTSMLRRKKYDEIKNQHSHNSTEVKNNLEQYKKQLVNIEVALNLNTAYTSCALYKKLKTDLDNLFNRDEMQSSLRDT